MQDARRLGRGREAANRQAQHRMSGYWKAADLKRATRLGPAIGRAGGVAFLTPEAGEQLLIAPATDVVADQRIGAQAKNEQIGAGDEDEQNGRRGDPPRPAAEAAP